MDSVCSSLEIKKPYHPEWLDYNRQATQNSNYKIFSVVIHFYSKIRVSIIDSIHDY